MYVKTFAATDTCYKGVVRTMKGQGLAMKFTSTALRGPQEEFHRFIFVLRDEEKEPSTKQALFYN